MPKEQATVLIHHFSFDPNETDEISLRNHLASRLSITFGARAGRREERGIIKKKGLRLSLR